MAPVWEALNRGDTYVVEVTNMRADGTRFPVEVHSAGFDTRATRASSRSRATSAGATKPNCATAS